MDLPLEGPFSQITALLSANVNKGLGAAAVTNKVEILTGSRIPPQTSLLGDRVQMLQSQVSPQNRIRRWIYHATSKLSLDADVGGWDVTGQSYFAASAVPVKDCLVLLS